LHHGVRLDISYDLSDFMHFFTAARLPADLVIEAVRNIDHQRFAGGPVNLGEWMFKLKATKAI
jgi:hypothetical protein